MGQNFHPDVAVHFGEMAAAEVRRLSSYLLVVRTPAHPVPDTTVDVTITNPDGQAATLENAFTFRLNQPTIQHHTLTSPEMQSELPIDVYLPPGYAESERAYPVLYMVPGSGSGPEIVGFLKSEADQLIATDEIPPLIMVGIYSPRPQPAVVFSGIIPFVDAHFRTIPLRTHRGIMGFSLGGRMTYELAFQRSDLFGLASSLAGVSFDFDFATRFYDAGRYPMRFWFWHGRLDRRVLHGISEALANRLEEEGWEYVFHSTNSGHGPNSTVRQLALRYVSQFFAEVPLWSPPTLDLSFSRTLLPGKSVQVQATARPARLETPDATTRIAADLSAIGGPAAIPFKPGEDGLYRLETTVVVAGLSGNKKISVRFEQGRQTPPYAFEIERTVPV